MLQYAQPLILSQHQSAQEGPKKEHYRVIDFDKSTMALEKVEPSTAADYRALVKKRVWPASFR